MAVRFTRAFFLPSAVLLFCVSLAARPVPRNPQALRTGSVWVVVKSAEGGPVAQAQVLIVVQGLPGTPVDRTADDSGLLSLELRPGAYYLIVESKGFVTENRHVQVQEGDSQTVEILLRVPQSPGTTVTAFAPASVTPVITFPQHTHAVSPNTRYDLAEIDRDDFGTHHAIYIQDRDKPDSDPRRLFSYDGRVDLAWNSGSDLIAITDYAGVDSSRCKVLDPFDKKLYEIKALDELLRSLPAVDRKTAQDLLRDHHMQLQTCSWSGPRELRLEFLGYQDGNSVAFTRAYTWNVP